MSVIRKRPSRYVAVDNAVARDRRLSFRARGLLVYMLSLPEDSQFSADRLASEGQEGRGAVLTALRELREAGYYRTARAKGDKGRWITVTEVSSEAVPEWIADTEPGPTEGGLLDVGGPDAGNPTSNTENEERKTEELTDTSNEVSAQKPVPDTAATLLAEWLDHCDRRPPGRVVGHVAREIKILLTDDGIAPDVVRRGLAVWHHKRLHPSALASCVSEALLGPGDRAQSRAERALTQGASVVAQLQAEEAATGVGSSPERRAVGS